MKLSGTPSLKCGLIVAALSLSAAAARQLPIFRWARRFAPARLSLLAAVRGILVVMPLGFPGGPFCDRDAGCSRQS
jgi:hypothetical protein